MLKIAQAQTSLGSFNQGSEKAPSSILEITLKDGLAKNQIQYKLLEPITISKQIATSKSEKLRNHTVITDFNKRLYEQIMSAASNDDIILTLGGDHSVSIGSMFASKARLPKTCLVYIDAHPDCNNPIDSPTGNIHGMPLSTVLGDALYSDFNLPKFGYEEVFIIAAKDIDDAELKYLKKHNISYYTIDTIIEQGISAVLKEVATKIAGRTVHVSLDIDSIDSSEAPGTGIINKGGLTFREISYLCRHLAKQNIIAIDCVEVNPDKDNDNQTILLAGDLIISLLGQEWSPYTQYLQRS
jgi:arginase